MNWLLCVSNFAMFPESHSAIHMLCSLRDGKPRDLVNDVAAGPIPQHDLVVDVDGIGKGLIALRVVDVDGLPGREDEH